MHGWLAAILEKKKIKKKFQIQLVYRILVIEMVLLDSLIRRDLSCTSSINLIFNLILLEKETVWTQALSFPISRATTTWAAKTDVS
jgi:hypothetical protein